MTAPYPKDTKAKIAERQARHKAARNAQPTLKQDLAKTGLYKDMNQMTNGESDGH